MNMIKTVALKSVLILVVALIAGCTPQQRYNYHFEKLEALRKAHPEFSKKDSVELKIDSIVKARLVELKAKLKLEVDSAALEEAKAQGAAAVLKVFEEKQALRDSGDTTCDKLARAYDSLLKARNKTATIYQNAVPKIDPISTDTLGVKITAFSKNGKLYFNVHVDSIQFKASAKKYFTTPKCPEYKEKKSWLTEFIIACVVALLAIFIKYRR